MAEVERLLASPSYAPALEQMDLSESQLNSPAGEAVIESMTDAANFASSAGFTMLPFSVLGSPQVSSPSAVFTFVDGTCASQNAIVVGNITVIGQGFFTSPAGECTDPCNLHAPRRQIEALPAT